MGVYLYMNPSCWTWARWLSWLEHPLRCSWEVPGSIPGQAIFSEFNREFICKCWHLRIHRTVNKTTKKDDREMGEMTHDESRTLLQMQVEGSYTSGGFVCKWRVHTVDKTSKRDGKER